MLYTSLSEMSRRRLRECAVTASSSSLVMSENRRGLVGFVHPVESSVSATAKRIRTNVKNDEKINKTKVKKYNTIIRTVMFCTEFRAFCDWNRKKIIS